MVIFLLDENKTKANADRLEHEGYPSSTTANTTTGAGAGGGNDENNENSNKSSNNKATIKRPGSIHAEMNSPARIYFKTVSSNKKLPPAVIYYHSLSSNKQIKDHNVRLPTPPATAAAIYYHRLDKNQQHSTAGDNSTTRASSAASGSGSSSIESTPSRQAAAIYSQALDRNRTNKLNSKYLPLGQDDDHDTEFSMAVVSPPHYSNSTTTTTTGEAPMSPGGSSHGRSSTKTWPIRRPSGHLKPPLSPTPTSPPPSSKMLMKGGAFQRVYHNNNNNRQPPSPGSPSCGTKLSRASASAASHRHAHPPALPLNDDGSPPQSPSSAVPTTSSSLSKLPSLLKPNRKYHRDISRGPIVSASSTLSSKSSDDSDSILNNSVHSSVVNSKDVAEIEVQEITVAGTTKDSSKKRHSSTTSKLGSVTSSTSTNTTGSAVKFGQIEILDFPIRLGDNPSVRFGAPIALGEKPTGKRILTVEEYENDRTQRLKRNEIVLDVMVRSDMLKQAGFSQKELRKAISEAAQARASRKKHAEKFLKEHGWGSILASSLENEGGGSDSGSVKSSRSQRE